VTKKKVPPAEVPADFLAALAAAPEAEQRFGTMPPSHKREYVVWIEGARNPETRARRVAAAVQRILSGA
jgi:uncharacterized protein YdeI (YjbR/CyaY-like superfamily)